MKLLFSLALIILLAGSASAQASLPAKSAAPSIMTLTLREGLDTTVSPCKDFDQFSNGGWKAKHANLKFDAFLHVQRHTDDRLLVILEAARKAAPTTTDPTIKVLGTFYASCLAADTVETVFPLTPGGVLPLDRASKCLSATDQLLRPALGQAFVGSVMSLEVTRYTKSWLEIISASIGDEIKQLTWIQDSVKQSILTRLTKTEVGISLVPTLADYSGFTLSPTNYAENRKNIPIFEKARISKLPTDSNKQRLKEPPVYPHHFSAFAMRDLNKIVVSTVLFQQPFFDYTAEPAANYASLGLVIGHEIWHVLTPYLRQISVDKNRVRSGKVADQYRKMFGGNSGGSTLNEDLADIGGLRSVYRAWSQQDKSKATPLIEGFTPDQRFFLYYGRLWRNPYGSSIDNVHSGARARVNGVVMHIPAFGKAFGCKAGDPMYIPPDSATDIFHNQ